jgi:hypothetical protein
VHQTAVGRDDVNGNHVIKCQTKAPRKPAEATAERESADTRV